MLTCDACGTRMIEPEDDPQSPRVVIVSGLVRRLLALAILVLFGFVLWGRIAAC